jgi:hypothetical protein
VMSHPTFRIAWSVAWGLVAVLLVVLWERSYRSMDAATLLGEYSLSSIDGRIFFNKPVTLSYIGPITWAAGGLTVPHWVSIALALVTSLVPWLPRRFSLRTLLIATTLFALVLGIIVFVSRVG